MSFDHEALPSFAVTVQRYDSVATLVVSGELDLATVPRLSAAVAEHGDAKLLVLDMTATTFLDSTGVTALLRADRRSLRSGSRMVVVAGDGAVRRVLELCELDGRLTIVSDHPAPAAEAEQWRAVRRDKRLSASTTASAASALTA